jgi:hypothetical protein
VATMDADKIVNVIGKYVNDDTLFEIIKDLCTIDDAAFGPIYLRTIHMRAKRRKENN